MSQLSHPTRALITVLLHFSLVVSFLQHTPLATYVDATPVGSLTITSVAVNNSSAKIAFQLMPGAKDYRIYDVTNPNDVKYAGLRHIDLTDMANADDGTYQLVMGANGLPKVPLTASTSGTGPQIMDIPNPQIEWNGLGDRKPHTLIVEAVDALGPVPPANLYDDSNLPLVDPLPKNAMLGSDKGPTPDGKISTNGQGPSTNNPQVIARSQPFVAQALASVAAIPSQSSATQTFFDDFSNAEGATFAQTARDDDAGTMNYTLNAGTSKEWSITYANADTENSMPFIASDHFMDMLFDGGTPGTNVPLHQGHGEMGMSPKQTADFSGGKLLHLTMEVDGHLSARRWLSMALSPADDPFTSFDPQSSDGFNTSDKSLFLQFFPGEATLDVTTKPTSAKDKTPEGVQLWGAAGQGLISGDDSSDLGGNGLGFDDRTRYDFFLTQTHAALFKDGELIQQSDMPSGSIFPQAKVYFIHYVYHSDQEENSDERDLLNPDNCYPMNAFWFNDPVKGTPVGDDPNQTSCGVAYPPGFGFRYSDERHWDNMGFEVLPASDIPANQDFSSLASLLHLPAPQPPVFASQQQPQYPYHSFLPAIRASNDQNLFLCEFPKNQRLLLGRRAYNESDKQILS